MLIIDITVADRKLPLLIEYADTRHLLGLFI